MDADPLSSMRAEIHELRTLVEDGLKQIRDQVHANALAHYAQVEALLSLHNVIRFKHPLPPMRGWSISPDFALILISVIRAHRPRVIVELGSGVSTIICGYVLEGLGAGRLISLEHVPVFAEISSRAIQLHELSPIAQIKHAPLRTLELPSGTWQWYDPACLNGIEAHSVDLVIVDGPPGHTQPLARYPAIPALHKWMRSGALVLVDDANRPDEKRMVDRWLSEGLCRNHLSLQSEKGAMLLMAS